MRIEGETRLDIVLDEIPTLWDMADAVLWVRPTDIARPTVVEVLKKPPGLAVVPGSGFAFAGWFDVPLASHDDCVLFLRVPGDAVPPTDPRSMHRVIAVFWLRDGRVSRRVSDLGSAPAKASALVMRLRVMQRAKPEVSRLPERTDVIETVRQDDRAFGVIRSITLDRNGPGPSLYELWNQADGVLHLRVEQSLGAAPWAFGGDKTGRIVSLEYRAAVIETLKSHALGGPTDRVLAFLQTAAGEWRDQSGRAYRTSAGPPEEPYSVGEELIAFLRWDASVERFWRTMVFRIRDGRVHSGEWGNNAIRQGTAVEGLLERLRAMGTRRVPESD
jgi:hypothetical protein